MNNRVKMERVTRNLTQSDIAEKLSVSRQTVYAIENGKYIPSTVLALKIAALFGKCVEDIFELEEGE